MKPGTKFLLKVFLLAGAAIVIFAAIIAGLFHFHVLVLQNVVSGGS